MSKLTNYLKQASKIVASWPPWKRNLLENSLKSTCPAREPIQPKSRLPNHKYLVQLNNGHRRAVVIDWTPEDAQQRALMHDPRGGWENSTFRIITRVRRTMTNLVLSLETK